MLHSSGINLYLSRDTSPPNKETAGSFLVLCQLHADLKNCFCVITRKIFTRRVEYYQDVYGLLIILSTSKYHAPRPATPVPTRPRRTEKSRRVIKSSVTHTDSQTTLFYLYTTIPCIATRDYVARATPRPRGWRNLLAKTRYSAFYSARYSARQILDNADFSARRIGQDGTEVKDILKWNRLIYIYKRRLCVCVRV